MFFKPLVAAPNILRFLSDFAVYLLFDKSCEQFYIIFEKVAQNYLILRVNL